MKAVKIFSVMLAMVLCLSGCGSNKKDDTAVPTQTPTPSDTQALPDASKVPQENDVVKPSEKEEKTDNGDKALYWCMEAEGDLNISYHLKDCKLIADEKVTEISAEIVKTIGLNHCPECNPPKY